MTDDQIIQIAAKYAHFDGWLNGDGAIAFARALLAAASAQTSQQEAETFVLRALIAAGHVSQAKVDEAFSIAATTPGITQATTDSVRRDEFIERVAKCTTYSARTAQMICDDARALSQQPAQEG